MPLATWLRLRITTALVIARPPVPAVGPLIAALHRVLDTKAGDAVTQPDMVVAITEAWEGSRPDTPSSDEAVAALAKVLRASDMRRRIAAAAAMGRFHAGNTLFTALTDLIGERDIVVRLAVIQAIHDVHFGAPFCRPEVAERSPRR